MKRAKPAAKPTPATLAPLAPAQRLQALLWPEQGVITEREMFLRTGGPAFFDDHANEIRFEATGFAAFDTACNLFNIGKWVRHCGLNDVRLRLQGRGSFELTVIQAMPERSWERLVNRIVTLDNGAEVDLTHFVRHPVGGVLYFTLHSLGEGCLREAEWVTTQQPKRQPDLALCITTFKREEAVRASVSRFETFMQTSRIAPHLHLLVVDNGQSAGLSATARVTPIQNENLGGSGGFARGLIEAEARGASHCLFMDDDASVLMGAIERVWAFLGHAINPATAVSGGLTKGDHRWSLWESGAIFNRWCRPQWLGTDLRDFHQVLRMEFGSTGPKPANFYGGWWFFAFPVAETRYRPFPFFVRGDDISFSIANRFDIVTLPGVLTFQDTDFSDKESLQTLYLDLRSHLIHHLALPNMEIGWRGALGVPAGFFYRSLVQCHYETLASLNLSLEDVLRGPDFFATNADMAARRASIAALRKTEAWVPQTTPPPEQKVRINPHGPGWRALVWRVLLNCSANGHLLPFFGYWGNHITIAAGQRGHLPAIWGAASITYISPDGGQRFTVRHSKVKALGQGLRLLRNLMRLAFGYGRIRDDWRRGYARLASTEFWQRRLSLPVTTAEQAQVQGMEAAR